MSKRKLKNKKIFLFEECWSRVKESTGLENYAQLADIVHTSPSNISKRKDEENFPPEWAYWVADSFNLSVKWILTGEGKKKLGDEDFFDTIRTWVQDSSGQGGNEWFLNQFREAFPMFEKWEQKKEGREVPKIDKVNTKVA